MERSSHAFVPAMPQCPQVPATRDKQGNPLAPDNDRTLTQAVGQVASKEIEGEGGDGPRFKLSDYQRLKGTPFALPSVNTD